MTIPYFAEHQTDVFVPAFAAGAVAALLVVLPIVFAPAVARARRGRLVVAGCAVLAAAALVLAGQQTAAGLVALGMQRDRVVAELRTEYGVRVGQDAAARLIDGSTIRLPAYGSRAVRLRSTGGDDYEVVVGGTTLPRQA